MPQSAKIQDHKWINPGFQPDKICIAISLGSCMIGRAKSKKSELTNDLINSLNTAYQTHYMDQIGQETPDFTG